jgi:protein SCO1/2
MSQLKYVLLAILGLALGIALALGIRAIRTGSLFGPHEFNAGTLTPPEPVADFTLTNQSGSQTSLSAYEGDVVALYFGYTYCPDVCPATLADLAGAREIMGEDGDDLQVIMVTADPARDTPELLANYLDNFDRTFVGMTGSPEELAAVYSQFGIFVQEREGATEEAYLVDHTSSVIVIDKEMNWRLLLPFGMSQEAIASDLAYLVNE